VTPICPYCRAPIDSDDQRKDCPSCGTPHHRDCFVENMGCTVFGCAQAPVDEPRVTVSGSEAADAVSPAPATVASQVTPERPATVAPPPSIFGLNDPLVLDDSPSPAPAIESPAATYFLATGVPSPTSNSERPAAIASPPPPQASTDTTAVPPPPFPSGAPGASLSMQDREPPLSMAEMYASFHPPKSRVTFVLLGVFLGALGVHNFYAGYVRKAAAQLCITLFTCFYGSFISWIWAVFEVCTVKQDNEGVEFS
jgi:TM2 domain-containing membrane protein YozV